MNEQEIEHIRAAVGVPVGDPDFFCRAFVYVAKRRALAQRAEKNPFVRIFADEHLELTDRMAGFSLQDSCAVRQLTRARQTAELLIDEKGNLDKEKLKAAIEALSSRVYFLGPDRQEEGARQERMLRMLRLLDSRKDLVLALQNINKPSMHKHAEQILRHTLHLSPQELLTNAHARRAALSALFCTLRQSLGSCFATAPAIFIHDEFPQLFLTDLNEMLSTGQLKRVAAGAEYAVPLARGWGVGDLKRAFFLSGDNRKDAKLLAQQPGIAAALGDGAGLEEMVYRALPYVFTAEELISTVLLNRNNITVKDLEEYRRRPNDMVQGPLMVHVPTSGRVSGGKGQACVHYLHEFAEAKNAFKAVADNPLLRAWEYTIASFAESKADFAKWNFYSSLGLRPEDQGGLGPCLYVAVKEKLDQQNRRVQELDSEYEKVFYEAKTMEARFRSVASEQEARWIRIEYQTKVNEMYAAQDERDRAHVMAKRLAGLYDKLIDFYIDSFPRYFQEVYDPEMVDISGGLYDDSPAGFRLVFKHGRANTSLWTQIDDAQGFVQGIVSFFTMTEREMDSDPDLKGMQSAISDITTKLITHTRTSEFMESAFYRMAVSHGKQPVKDPLDHLDKIEAKPWAYTSGGNLEVLLSTYFRKGEKLVSASTWVESSRELLVFILDTLKQIPPEKMAVFRDDPEATLLMHSPTHVFLLKPGRSPLREGWENQDFTYTWVRDEIIIPAERAVDRNMLNEEMIGFLIEQLTELLPAEFRPRFSQAFGKISGTMTPSFFQNYVMETIQHDPVLNRRGMPILPPSAVDALLYAMLPLFPAHQLKERVRVVVKKIPGLTTSQRDDVLALLEGLSPDRYINKILSANMLQEICQGLLCLAFNNTAFGCNFQKLIVDACRSEGLLSSKPVLFADSNWACDDFAFVINPGTGKFDFWRTDRLGITGEPMNVWKEWLDGSKKSPVWGIFYKRYEYTV